ncbi:hypothetical protein ACHAPE_002970 [Trichoderma viride]
MAIESLVPLVKDYPNRSLLESLNKNSALLQRLEKDFSNAFGTRSVRIVSFYETEKSPTAMQMEDGKWKLSGDAEVLVDVPSATCGSKHQHPINRNHSEMVKYNNQYDELYKRVRIALEPLVSRLQSKSVTVSTEVGSCPLVSSSDENEIIDCLRSHSFREQEHRYKKIYSAQNTCEWLLEDAQYQAWMNRPRGLFWIKGNPGVGKSVLMKFAATMMDRRKSGELVVSFFVHGRGTPLQKTPLGIFRALLNSMLISFPEYLSQLTKRFNDQEKRFGTYQENRWSWTEEELQDLISEVLTKGTKNRPVTIFVDAIDECGQGHAKELLEYFKSIMNNVEREEAQVKICFSSRHFPLLSLSTMSTISVEERNDKDIRLVIQERLSQIQPRAKRQQIEKDILLKAQGGFQWVILTTTIVTDGITIGIKAEKLHEKITTTPETLEELYTNILSGVTETERHQMTKLFQWVLFAERPLSTHELREALATDKDMTCTTVSKLRSHDSWSDSLEDFEKHVRHISRGLVEFNTRDIWEQYEPDGEDSDREAQFIHQSVADYILGKFLNHVRPGDATQSQIGAGHFELSRACLRYLTLSEVSEGAQLPRGTFSARFPLVPYVVQFVFHHIREVEQEGIPQCDLLPLIQRDRQSGFLRKIASIWRVMDPNNAHAPIGWPFIGATPLHALIALGSKSAFDALLQKNDVEVDCRDSEGYTPLLLALRECRQDMALALLNRSIEWQLRSQSTTQDNDIGHRRNYFVDVNAENDDGEMPLTIALTVNAGEVIFKLIEAGADLKYFGKQTALVVYAIRNRNKTLLLKLLEKKVKLDGVVYSVLRELSYEDDDDDDVLKELLLEVLKGGANMSKSPDFNKSYENGSDDEGDDEDEDEGEDGALLLASRRGQTAIVNLLLSYGASASSQNEYRKFALLEAVENGHEPIVKLLLENGGDVNAKSTGTNGHTLLWAALGNRHEAVARLLINHKADVNASDEDGSTPLIWAVRDNDETLATLLINSRADVNASDKDKLTPLIWAVWGNNETLARLLINNGADVNASDKEKSMPLMWAVWKGHEAVVRHLIDNGANVNASDKYGLTPLLWASTNGNEALLRLLTNNGG